MAIEISNKWEIIAGYFLESFFFKGCHFEAGVWEKS